MGADLHIHIFEGITEDDLRIFFSNHLGSKYLDLHNNLSWEDAQPAHDRVSETPNIWIGEISWLKAVVLDDAETFVPGPVAKIYELIGEDLPVLDDKLIKEILEALKIENKTSYSVEDKEDDIKSFLEKHKGKKVFTVSW